MSTTPKEEKGRYELKVVDYVKYIPSEVKGMVAPKVKENTLIKFDTATGRVWRWIDEKTPSNKEPGKYDYFNMWSELVDYTFTSE
jgi:hypothetical protein